MTDFPEPTPAPAPTEGATIELDGVAEAIAEGDGFWRSCSGCHETNEGVPLGAYSSIMKCHLGMGCRECGGIGAIWDATNYIEMCDFMASETALAAPAPEAVSPWRPIAEADNGIAYIQDFGELKIGNSYPIWARDADGRVFECLWSDNGKKAYWWDLEGESPVDPVEYMPHPLAALNAEGK